MPCLRRSGSRARKLENTLLRPSSRCHGNASGRASPLIVKGALCRPSWTGEIAWPPTGKIAWPHQQVKRRPIVACEIEARHAKTDGFSSFAAIARRCIYLAAYERRKSSQKKLRYANFLKLLWWKKLRAKKNFTKRRAERQKVHSQYSSFNG